MQRFTHPLVAFARAAGPGSGTLRTLAGIALTLALIAVFAVLTRAGALALAPMLAPETMAAAGIGGVEARDPSSPLGALLILVTFAAVWPALWIVLPLVHGRDARTLFGPTRRLNWRQLRWGMAISIGVGAAAWLPILLSGKAEPAAFAPLSLWLALAALALPLVFIQTAAEELLFRGYLLQQFAARSWSVLGWSLLPSLLFAMAHGSAGGPFGISWFHFAFGLIMAAVTSRTANLGAAIGLHFGNNLVNLLVVSPAHMVSGLALFTIPAGVEAPLWIYVVVMFIGAAAFMGFMDFRFVRAWKAQKQRDADAKAAAEPPAVAAE